MYSYNEFVNEKLVNEKYDYEFTEKVTKVVPKRIEFTLFRNQVMNRLKMKEEQF